LLDGYGRNDNTNRRGLKGNNMDFFTLLIIAMILGSLEEKDEEIAELKKKRFYFNKDLEV
jgi:hypothetical protein